MIHVVYGYLFTMKTKHIYNGCEEHGEMDKTRAKVDTFATQHDETLIAT